MNGEEKFWVSVWGIVATAVVAIFLVCTRYHDKQHKQFIKAGYCETTIVGSERVVWQKCKE